MKIKKIQTFCILLSTLLIWGGVSSGSIDDSDLSPTVSTSHSVVINELSYNPSAASDSIAEFIEVYNDGSSAVDMSGWWIGDDDGTGTTLPGSTSLAAGEYLVVVANGGDPFWDSYKLISGCTLLDGSVSMGNSGDVVFLNDTTTNIETVSYVPSPEWGGNLVNGGGKSLERVYPGMASTNTSNWGASIADFGTPCEQNSIHYSIETVPTLISHSHRPWTPTADSDITFEVTAIDYQAIKTVSVDVSSDNFASNTTLTLADDNSDDTYEASFTVGSVDTSYTYSVKVEDSAGQIVKEWNNLMNFTVADVYPFISGFSPSGGGTEFVTLSFDGRGSASSYDLSGLDIVVGGEYLGSLGTYDSVYRFPSGSSIQHSETIILTENGTEFETDFGFAADFEFNGTSSAIDMIAVEFGGTLDRFGIHNGADELLLVDSGSVLDAVIYTDYSTPIFRGDTGLSVANLPSASSQYAIASRDNDDPLNDFLTVYFPYARPNNILNNSQVAPNLEVTLDIFDRDGLTNVLTSWDGAANVTLTSPYKTNVPSALGSHTLKIFANDTKDYYSLLTYVYTVSDAPVFTLLSPSNNAVIPASATVSVSIADSDGVGSVDYNWDGAANTSMTVEQDNTYDITGPSVDGAHTLNVYSADINDAESSASFTFTVDGTKPVLTLNSPTNNTSVDEGTVVDLDVTDTNLASVSISVNDAASTALASPYDYTLSTAGSIQLEITAVDDAGNSATLLLKYIVIADEPTTTPTTPTTPTTTSTSDESDSPGFIAIYVFLTLFSVVQIVRFSRFKR
ncbi:MAG: lamin tail domain-containing protein [Candidatus Kariarchaeaceae archaeon]|jgi:hypothetical protein